VALSGADGGLARLPWQESLWARIGPNRGVHHHAWLLRGPEGIGKGQFARALAAAWLCQRPAQDGSACGQCDACGWFVAGNHPDFRRLTSAARLQQEGEEALADSEGEPAGERKAASQQITIEQVRALGQFFSLTTHRAGLRVLLIEPAEALNTAAANALLKTLEEPPAGTRFLLVSSQARRLAPTLVSRCLPVTVPVPPPLEALAWLRSQGVAPAEQVLAQAAGRPLRALALAGSGEIAERSQFLKVLADPDFDPHALAEKAARESLGAWTEWMQTWCHDLMLARQGAAPRFHPDQASALGRLAARLDPGRLLDWELRLRAARYESRQPVNARLFCDELLMRYGDLFR